jgi:hypothetical protein
MVHLQGLAIVMRSAICCARLTGDRRVIERPTRSKMPFSQPHGLEFLEQAGVSMVNLGSGTEADAAPPPGDRPVVMGG